MIAEADGSRQATILATGSEVAVALTARGLLKAKGIETAVVSMPCWELFEQQPRAYRSEVLGAAPRVAVEAAVRFGWDRYIGADGVFIGMNGFGASGDYPDLLRHFDITPEAVSEAVRPITAICSRLALAPAHKSGNLSRGGRFGRCLQLWRCS